MLPQALCTAHLHPVLHATDTPDVQRREIVRAASHPLPLPDALPDSSAYPWTASRITAAPAVIDTLIDGCLWYDGCNSLAFDRWQRPHPTAGIGSTMLIESLIQNATPRRISHRVFLLGVRGTGNYYHWMLDVIPRLELLIRAGYRFTRHDRFVLPHVHHAFQRQTLAEYGIGAGQLVLSGRSTLWLRADTLVLPQFDNHMGLAMAAWVPQSVCSRFARYHPATASRVRRLYVARSPRRAQGRELLNQPDVVHQLERLGFECVYPERLCLREQVRVFAESRIVVAPHGAALANIVHCPRATAVVEAYGQHLAPCYWAISALQGLDYYHLPADTGASADDPYERARTLDARRSASFHIDAIRLAELVGSIVE